MIPAKIVLVEGADGTGKTTFVRDAVSRAFLQDLPEPRVIHNDASDHRLPGSLYRHYRAQLLDALDFRDRGVSTYIDRSFLSEFIYGDVYRNASRISYGQAKRLERFARHHGIELLGMTADLDVRRRRIRARGEEWDAKQPFVGAFYAQHFRDRGQFWLTVDSSSAPVLN